MPNLHPLLVHFPIVLLLAATLVDLCHAGRPDRAALRETATWLYCTGALAAMGAYFSGLEAAGSLGMPAGARAAVTEHFTWAERTTWYFVFFASFRVAMSYIWGTRRRAILLVSSAVGLVGLGLLLMTAERGGRLVFQYGVGVQGVPAPERPWTIQEDATSRPE